MTAMAMTTRTAPTDEPVQRRRKRREREVRIAEDDFSISSTPAKTEPTNNDPLRLGQPQTRLSSTASSRRRRQRGRCGRWRGLGRHSGNHKRRWLRSGNRRRRRSSCSCSCRRCSRGRSIVCFYNVRVRGRGRLRFWSVSRLPRFKSLPRIVQRREMSFPLSGGPSPQSSSHRVSFQFQSCHFVQLIKTRAGALKGRGQGEKRVLFVVAANFPGPEIAPLRPFVTLSQKSRPDLFRAPT